MKYIYTVFIFATISTVSAQVSQEWARRYDGPSSGTDKANAIVVDAVGNVYVTGSSMSGGVGTEDFATIKYDAAGTLQWTRRYDAGSSDIAYAIAIDNSGSIYVTGGSGGSGSNQDFLTIKYSPAGDTMWTRRYNGPRNGKDVAYAITVDDSGYIFVTGESEGSTGTHGIFEDYATIKYDSAGTLKWSARYNGPAGDYDRANSVAVDRSGNVYVTGTSDGGSSGSGSPFFDYATIKYNAAGVLQWVRRYNGPGSSDDEAKSVKVDTSGNVFVTGYSPGSSTFDDIATIKYNAAGDTLWTSRYDGPGSNDDQANALIVDKSGNVFVTGKSYGGPITGDDFVTIKYNSGGDTLWVRRYNGSASGSDGGTAIALDKLGNAFVTGYSTGVSTTSDYATIKYSASGVEQWVIEYTNGASAGSSDAAAGIFVDTLFNVYVCGMSALDYATIKYSQTASDVARSPRDLPVSPSLLQNYPNPFNPITSFEFSVPSRGYVSLQVFNVLGQEIASLVAEELSAGTYTRQWDGTAAPSGIYYYRLEANGHSETKRLVLLK
jgi:uncharacterized delta-60 repeat protein